MDWSRFLIYLAVMAGVTYLIRMLPLAAIRGRVRSVFLQSFLYYCLLYTSDAADDSVYV